MAKSKLYLIDAMAFCYRAFYAVKELATSFGQPTNAVFGFVNMLNKILKDKKPEFIAVCFDVSRDTFRQKKFAEYKVQRPAMPEGLSCQIPLIKEIIRAMGITIFEKVGFEADDIIATLAQRAEKKDLTVTIVSSDKDMLQLVEANVKVFNPYKDEGVILDKEQVLERFKVGPERIIDIVSLMGDSADNIPGVPGIGEKTAVGLIREFGTLDKLLTHLDKVKQPKLRQAISDNIDKIKLNRELATLDKEVKLDFNLDELKAGNPDCEELFKLYKRLEFKAFLKGLPVCKEEAGVVLKAKKYKQAEHSYLFKDGEGVILFCGSEGEVYFSREDEVFSLNPKGKAIKAMLHNSKIKKTSHDLKRIKVTLAGKGAELNGLSFDTMIAAYLLNPSKPGYSLSDLSWDYLEKPLRSEDADGLRSIDLIRDIKPRLEKELKEKNLLKLFLEIEMPLVDCLAVMELNGIRLDLAKLKKLSSELEKRLIKLIEDIYEMSGVQFNINSPKQLRQILFEKLKLPVVKKTKTGPSTDEEVLNKLASQHKLPAKLLEYRQLMKLKNTYIDALPELADKDTHKVHTSFNQTGTETGRLSSSNPNLQNIPIKTELGRSIREAIIAFSDDSRLLSCDYSQIELRIMAHMSGDETLVKAFNQGKDIHRITASLIYNIEEKDVLDEMREVAKRINFGIIYGLSAYGLSRDLGISQFEAQQFIDAYFLRYPKVSQYIQDQIKLVEKVGFVTTILGRRRYLPEINNRNQSIRQLAQRQSVNTPIQGSASDLIKSAMVKIHQQIKDAGFKTRMILQIHDELLFDLPVKETKEFVNLARDTMENVFHLSVPIKVDVKIGRDWGKMEEII
ncbi:MAG: DNA polymerase I [Candidatus Omnitrophota bacterium]